MSKVKPPGYAKKDHLYQPKIVRTLLFKSKMMTNACRNNQAGVRSTTAQPPENGVPTRNGVKTCKNVAHVLAIQRNVVMKNHSLSRNSHFKRLQCMSRLFNSARTPLKTLMNFKVNSKRNHQRDIARELLTICLLSATEESVNLDHQPIEILDLITEPYSQYQEELPIHSESQPTLDTVECP